MKIKLNKIYKKGKDYYLPAAEGDFYIVDMWKCNKDGIVKDILKNPSPCPVITSGLRAYKDFENSYAYPKDTILWR
jgi:hypothetical protein